MPTATFRQLLSSDGTFNSRALLTNSGLVTPMSADGRGRGCGAWNRRGVVRKGRRRWPYYRVRRGVKSRTPSINQTRPEQRDSETDRQTDTERERKSHINKRTHTQTHAHTYTRARAHTHAHTHTRTHARTHAWWWWWL